jgi:outer membrane murein-binding lipoprotein Lpp
MKPAIKLLGAMMLGAALLAGGCAQKKISTSWESIKNPEVVAQLKSFVAEKEAQANAATNEAAPGFAPFFAAAERGDWLTVSNAFVNFRQHAGQYEHADKDDERLRGPKWQAIIEIWGTLYYFNVAGEKYSTIYANGIIESIPPGSIYFGGTDPGRFLITGMETSHVNADPFFLLTQNALADGTYLDYLRGMYGGKIYTPTAEDSQKCFADYIADVQQRTGKNQLKPGEDVHTDANGKVQVSGQVAVMEINSLLAKIIFDKNPRREFYIEESFPLDWMYPHLEPHGLIMKINRQPPASLSDEVIGNDRDYWTKQVAAMLGDWLNPDTAVADCAAFAQKVYVKRDLGGFKGDREFLQSDDAQKMFSKLRSSIAGLYAWRVKHPANSADKERMAAEADFAFRQAWVLRPDSPEAVFRYANFLLEQNRGADALLVAQTASQMPTMQGQEGAQLRGLVGQLEKFQKAK